MSKKITKRPLARLVKDERGNVAIMFGLMMIPICGIMGAAVDYSRAIRVQTQLQAAIDAGTMAALNEYQSTSNPGQNPAAKAQYAEQRLTAFVNESLARVGLGLSDGSPNDAGTVIMTNGNINTSDSSANPTLTTSVETLVLSIVGFDEFTVSASTDAAVAAASASGTKALELSLMLDISGSMTGDKMTDMQAAAQDFLDIVMPDDESSANRHVGLVPFAGKVNIGSRAYASAATGYAQTRDTVSGKKFSSTTFSWRSRTNCRNDVKLVYTSYNNSQALNYCASTFTSRGSGSSIEYWTPAIVDNMVTQYLRTCVTERSGAEAYTDAAPGTGTYVGVASKTSGISSQYTNDGKCIIDGSEQAAVKPLSTNKEALKEHIGDMVITSGTAGHVGTAWAYYMLSPLWNSFWGADVHDVVEYHTEDTVKSAVLMTDGEYNSNYESTSASAQALAICEKMKEDGIIVYTIGFDMSTDENDPARQTLVQCASPGKYYFPYTGEALAEAFSEIGNSLVTIVTTSSDDTKVVIKQ